MDARIAVITGTVFAGVLVAGALAAPRIDGNEPGSDLAAVTATDVPAAVQAVDEGYDGQGDDEYDDDGDERDERHHDDDDDDHDEDHDDEDDD